MTDRLKGSPGKRDHYDVVKEAMDVAHDGKARPGVTREAAQAAGDLLARLQRVKALGGDFAKIEVSEHFAGFVKLVGRPKLMLPFLRDAAAL